MPEVLVRQDGTRKQHINDKLQKKLKKITEKKSKVRRGLSFFPRGHDHPKRG